VHSASLRTRKRYQLEIVNSRRFITIARVLARKGGAAKSWPSTTDFPERFAERRQLSGLRPTRPSRVATARALVHKGGVVLKFAGVESISDAEQLAGWSCRFRASSAPSWKRARRTSARCRLRVWIADADGEKLLAW